MSSVITTLCCFCRSRRDDHPSTVDASVLQTAVDADGFEDWNSEYWVQRRLEREEREQRAQARQSKQREEFLRNVLISKTVVFGKGNTKPGKDADFHVVDPSNPGNCPVCLIDYEEGDVLFFSHNRKCPHHFHQQCILDWLKDHDECPCCRNNFLAFNDDDDAGNGTSTLPSSSSFENHPFGADSLARLFQIGPYSTNTMDRSGGQSSGDDSNEPLESQLESLAERLRNYLDGVRSGIEGTDLRSNNDTNETNDANDASNNDSTNNDTDNNESINNESANNDTSNIDSSNDDSRNTDIDESRHDAGNDAEPENSTDLVHRHLALLRQSTERMLLQRANERTNDDSVPPGQDIAEAEATSTSTEEGEGYRSGDM